MTSRAARSHRTDVKRFLLAMKITAAILLIFSLHVAAKGVSQTITLSGKRIPLKTVFAEIKKQSGYLVVSKKDVVDDAKAVSVDVQNYPLLKFLDETFSAQGLDYIIENKTIFVKRKPLTPHLSVGLKKENLLPISGIVKGVDGKPLANVSVVVKGTDKGTTTDEEGKFSIDVKQGDVLIVSSVGFGVKEVKINTANANLVIALEISSSPLDEVVFKGYYESAKRFNTGNVAKIKSEEISKQPIGNPVAALQGRVSGLSIQQSSGHPGSSYSVRLRGMNSIANNNDPLYIVDGVPFTSVSLSHSELQSVVSLSPFNALSPADIESIEILKDADATAIYGSRGANGVILITTKKGKAGNTALSVNVYSGGGKVMKRMDLLNTQQYLDMRKEAFKNDGLTFQPWDYDINGSWDTTRYTDWQKIFIGGTASILDAQLSLSGGNAQTQFTLTSGYRKETTIYPGDYFDRKINVHAGMTHRSNNQNFHLGLTANMINDDNRLPTENPARNILLAPDAPALYDENGKLNWQDNTWSNPFALLYRRNKAVSNNLLTSLHLSYVVLPGLRLKNSVGYNRMEMKQNVMYPLISFSPQFAANPQNREKRWSANSINAFIVEPQLEYERLFGANKLEAIIGGTFQDETQEAIAQRAIGFSSDALIENVSAASNTSVLQYTNTQYRYVAFYGRIGYNWKEKYLINLTARRDGSTRFGPNKRFGNFGSVGAGWIFSEEEFIKNNFHFLSYGKLRGSYGVTGNDKLGNYQFLSTYSPFPYSYTGLIGLEPSRLTNPDFGWEEIKKLEAAIELGFLEDKLLFSVSWYRNRTGNQLVGYSLPSTAGFTSVQANLPAIIQNNGLEIELNNTNLKNKNFSWTSRFNISFPRNKLVSYPNIEGSPYKDVYAVGKSLFISNLFHFRGVDPGTGLYTFEDLDKDGFYTYDDDRHFVYTGQDYFGGLQNTFTYKNWELDFLFQFVKQKGRNYYANGVPGLFGSAQSNQPSRVLERWRKAGDYTDIQKFSTIYLQENEFFDISDGPISDASYVRLKNLSLRWNAPEEWTKAIHLTNLKIYAQCQNLLTITSYEGLDPETGAIGVAPISMITGGIQITL